MQSFYLREENFPPFLNNLSKEYRIYLPQKSSARGVDCAFGFKTAIDDYLLKDFSRTTQDTIVFNPYRSVEPLKTFFTNPKEKLGRYFAQPQEVPREKIAIFGVKNCDLFSLKIQDFVFLEGSVKDPFYAKNRSNTFLITGDCLDFKEVCFCLALGINPFAQEGFDLNFSPLNAGFLVDLGSLAGADCVEKMANLFIPATAHQLAAREQKRNNLSRRLEEHLALHNIPEKEILPDIVRNGQAPQFWQEAVLNCVECGGCNLICDTCHCFLLSDERFGNVHEKVRSWDACLYANFARVAGGANPLRYRYQRLRNRYEKKFDFFPQNLGLSACCGCGRCIEVCPAKIDIREVLKNLKAQFIQKQG